MKDEENLHVGAGEAVKGGEREGDEGALGEARKDVEWRVASGADR